MGPGRSDSSVASPLRPVLYKYVYGNRSCLFATPEWPGTPLPLPRSVCQPLYGTCVYAVLDAAACEKMQLNEQQELAAFSKRYLPYPSLFLQHRVPPVEARCGPQSFPPDAQGRKLAGTQPASSSPLGAAVRVPHLHTCRATSHHLQHAARCCTRPGHPTLPLSLRPTTAPPHLPFPSPESSPAITRYQLRLSRCDSTTSF